VKPICGKRIFILNHFGVKFRQITFNLYFQRLEVKFDRYQVKISTDVDFRIE